MEKKVRISIHLKIKTENEHLKKIWFVLYVTNQVMNFFYTFSVLFTTDEDKIIAYYLIAKNRVYDAVKEDFWEKFGEKGVSLHFFPSFFNFLLIGVLISSFFIAVPSPQNIQIYNK